MISSLILLSILSGRAEPAAAPRCDPGPGRLAEQVRGEAARGRTFSAVTPNGWILRLEPAASGWLLVVSARGRETEDLARLTPPWHGAPNSREVEGWHFRNADNTGPNDGSVNAPQELREFIFSPEVGRGIEYSGAATRAEDVEKVRAFGRGWLFVEARELTPPEQGRRAAFETIRFSACLTWPEGGSAQGRAPRALGPPMPYEDSGACPFEGCAYREWTAASAVTVLAARRAGAPIAFHVKQGERVAALTGVVITIKPGRVEFRKAVTLNSASGPLHLEPGQSLYLLTYRGEGFTKAWFNGRIYDEVDGGTTFFGYKCEREPDACDGRIMYRPETVWWVQIRNRRGQTGWANQPEKFDGKSIVGGVSAAMSSRDMLQALEAPLVWDQEGR